MVTFLQEILADIKNSYSDIAVLTIILPSKRAGGFLMNELKNTNPKTQFAPRILSIEEFVEELSNLKIIDNTELLFKSYEAYLITSAIKDKDDFETYSTWATTLLNDFNEIDRYLVEPKPFFSYLASIKTLERWNVVDEKTEIINNYLRFWESLPSFYENIQSLLLKDNIGYQGMVYREAVANLEHYIQSIENRPHVFVGFNALNTAEQNIVQELLETGNTKIYWDTDASLYNDSKHSASYFIRKYIKEWKYFQNEKPQFIENNFEKPKHFKFVEVQMNVGQAKYVGELLSQLSEDEINKTTIVLGDENLLVPLLYSLPENVKSLNVTMGLSLKNFPSVVFFELLFTIHLRNAESLYYKDVLSILNHPLGNDLLPNATHIALTLTRENITHIKADELIKISNNTESEMLRLLFGDWKDNSKTAIDISLKILVELQKQYKTNSVQGLILYELCSLFNKIDALNQKYPYLQSVKSVLGLFSELAASSSLDFKGDAYKGLQLMGVLETRVLDFENLIITSVNEGVFPSGKSNASFITYDLKEQFKLPSFTEKDAIYTYHFYRLLQRASTITLLYNGHSEGMNTGEKSRFIRQLEIEKHPNHIAEKFILSPKVQIKRQPLKQIVKTDAVMQRLREIAEKDAIYTYHFYRLLQRASNITLLYNGHSEGMNTGEKSRFIRQLEIEKHPNHIAEKFILSPKVQIKQQPLKQIVKTDAVMQRLKEIAEKGFSPSALTGYIRNPLDFYFQRILGLQEFEEVEETVAANTLGTIVHDTLEKFYQPYEGSVISKEHLSEMKGRIHEEVTLQFKKTFKGGTFTKGKNLIVFEVAKRYISNFIKREIADVEAGNDIKIIKIEANLTLEIPIQELDFPVKIHGKVDRVDEYNGLLRIIDYKTGLVKQGDLEITEWEDLNQDYKFSKAFQVLTYALMMGEEIPMNNVEAGVISFKNLGSGFLKFGTKTSAFSKRDHQITEETLEIFTVELKKLILEICDPNIPFTEKEIN